MPPPANPFSRLLSFEVQPYLTEVLRRLLLPLYFVLSSLHRGPARGQKQQPSAKLQQCLSISLACSPSALHAVPSAAPNPSICPTGRWQEATAVFLQPNLDWPTLSFFFFFFFRGGPSFHSFPCMDEVAAFFQRHLHGNGNDSGSVTQPWKPSKHGEEKLVVE